MSLLRFDTVSASLGERRVLNGVTLSLEPGEMLALVGPNGAGKTSLMRVGLGLIPSQAGTVELGGALLNQLSPEDRAKRAAYLAQDRALAWSITGADLVALGRFAWGGGRAYEELGEADRSAVDGALKAADALTLKDRAVHQLSGGEQARLHLARLLASSAPLLIADEPVAGLDPRHQLDALAALKDETRRGAGVMVSLHDLSLAEQFADRIAVLQNGELAALGPHDTVLDTSTLKTVFGVVRREGGGFDPA